MGLRNLETFSPRCSTPHCAWGDTASGLQVSKFHRPFHLDIKLLLKTNVNLLTKNTFNYNTVKISRSTTWRFIDSTKHINFILTMSNFFNYMFHGGIFNQCFNCVAKWQQVFMISKGNNYNIYDRFFSIISRARV